MTDRLLTARELAERLAVSTETVLRWHRAGRLPGGLRLATGVLRWDEAELERWLDSRREVPAQSLTAVPGHRPLQTIAPAEQEATHAR